MLQEFTNFSNHFFYGRKNSQEYSVPDLSLIEIESGNNGHNGFFVSAFRLYVSEELGCPDGPPGYSRVNVTVGLSTEQDVCESTLDY